VKRLVVLALWVALSLSLGGGRLLFASEIGQVSYFLGACPANWVDLDGRSISDVSGGDCVIPSVRFLCMIFSNFRIQAPLSLAKERREI